MSNRKSSATGRGSATWKTNPDSGQWNTTSNWNQGKLPSKKAIFGDSKQTAITFSNRVADSIAVVGEIEFAPKAGGYFFNFDSPALENSPFLTITGKGVTNNTKNNYNEPINQNFIVASTAIGGTYPQLQFMKKASAGGPSIYYSVGPAALDGPGGGVIRFTDESTAGSANFSVTTGAGTPPRYNSTVGAEVSFACKSTAGSATFTISGTTSLTDGDTFGNVVFHNFASADNARFTNNGGTVPGGDGGNTQFYDSASAGQGVFYNLGGTSYGVLTTLNDGRTAQKQQGANGGDVAFDGSATGGNGQFHNFAGVVANANGGVTSFNNNPPNLPRNKAGANAGSATFTNYGANGSNFGTGGHTYFTSKHGSASADKGTFHNKGSSVASTSSAGRTVFSITEGTDGTSISYGDEKPTGKSGSVYFPTAGRGTFYNYPATTRAGAAGFTEFAVYQPWGEDGKRVSSSGKSKSSVGNSNNVPTAGFGTFHNLCGEVSGAQGGYTKFSNATRAGSATLIATGGGDGEPGQIEFEDNSLGEKAKVQLNSGGVLNIGYHSGALTIDSLTAKQGGVVKIQIGGSTTNLKVSRKLLLDSDGLTFSIYAKGSKKGSSYTILTAPNLSDYSLEDFHCKSEKGSKLTLTKKGKNLIVCVI